MTCCERPNNRTVWHMGKTKCLRCIDEFIVSYKFEKRVVNGRRLPWACVSIRGATRSEAINFVYAKKRRYFDGKRFELVSQRTENSRDFTFEWIEILEDSTFPPPQSRPLTFTTIDDNPSAAFVDITDMTVDSPGALLVMKVGEESMTFWEASGDYHAWEEFCHRNNVDLSIINTMDTQHEFTSHVEKRGTGERVLVVKVLGDGIPNILRLIDVYEENNCDGLEIV